MTKAQRTLLEIQGRQSEMRSRLAVLAAQDTRTADEDTELTAVETKLSGCEPEPRAALAAAAAEDDSARTVQTTGDPEARERREIRSPKPAYRRFSPGRGWRSRRSLSGRPPRMRVSLRCFVAQPTPFGDLPRRSTGDTCCHWWTGR